MKKILKAIDCAVNQLATLFSLIEVVFIFYLFVRVN